MFTRAICPVLADELLVHLSEQILARLYYLLEAALNENHVVAAFQVNDSPRIGAQISYLPARSHKVEDVLQPGAPDGYRMGPSIISCTGNPVVQSIAHPTVDVVPRQHCTVIYERAGCTEVWAAAFAAVTVVHRFIQESQLLSHSHFNINTGAEEATSLTTEH